MVFNSSIKKTELERLISLSLVAVIDFYELFFISFAKFKATNTDKIKPNEFTRYKLKIFSEKK